MTEKQKRWVAAYEKGMPPALAAEAAGYKDSYEKMGRINLQRYEEESASQGMRNASCLRTQAKERNAVADIEEITAFWTSILRDESADLKDKLKVSELLAKVQGAYAASAEEDEPLEIGRPFDATAMPLAEKLALIERIRSGELQTSSDTGGSLEHEGQ